MSLPIKRLIADLCLSGFVAVPALSVASATQNSSDNKNDTIASLKLELASLRKEMLALKNQVQSNDDVQLASNDSSNTSDVSNHKHHARHKHHKHQVHNYHKVKSTEPRHEQAAQLPSGRDFLKMMSEQSYLPFDMDVPGQAFVS